ncbi:PAAR domain-containing protein [Burkholderia ubonensis]|uniref:PAAR domain-containing protein n=1 Tax=Burkholderia ubonensis TaxID=101571 RepID=UPI0008FE5CA2|nr:PAAR domain-containing protein [Burkholderia ubonensis]
MKRSYLLVGDKSTSGGVVTAGIPNTSINGQQMTHLGATVACPACKSVGHIVPVGPRWPDGWMGQKVALEGDKVACGCQPMPVMLASQSMMFEQYDGDGLSSMGFAPSLAALPIEQWSYIAFKANDIGSLEGLRCVAHFDDGTTASGTFDHQNTVRFENPSGKVCQRVTVSADADESSGTFFDSYADTLTT